MSACVDLLYQAARRIYVGGTAADSPGLRDAQPRNRAQRRMIEHFRPLIGDPAATVLDDQVIRPCSHELLQRKPGQCRPAQPRRQIGEACAVHEIVHQRAGAGEIAPALVIGGDTAPAQPGQRRKLCIHAADQCLAAIRMTHRRRHLANLGDDFGVAPGRRQLERGMAPIGCGGEALAPARSDDDQIRSKSNDVFRADKGLLYLIDRLDGLEILESEV